ncbi:DUF6302 family protein [Streptomyces sp. NPDC000594]|uniref:DUF6302 family protein n=1 Tax=Streptomyces sp. NPDC000594 TaxID=3154261 RepID=UPI00332E3063
MTPFVCTTEPVSIARTVSGGSYDGAASVVSVEAPQAASAYPVAACSLADAALLTGAVALRVPGCREPLLAVPVGEGRLGGHVSVPRLFAGEAAAVLAALPGFAEARTAPDGRGGLMVVWGAMCPERISDAGRRRFYRGAGSGRAKDGPLALRDVVLVDALAHGSTVGALLACGLVASEREVHERLAVAGEALAGWRGMTWTAVAHAAVCRGVVPARPGVPVNLGPAGLALLNAWANGAPREWIPDLTGTAAGAALRLETTVLGQLGARSDLHAVLRGHEAGLLTRDAAVAGWGRGP